MRKQRKRFLSIVLSVLCVVSLLSGCGKGEKEEKKTVYKKTDVTLSNGVVPAKAAFGDNLVYYVSGDETNEKISTYDMEKQEEAELPISISEEEQVLDLRCSDSGELIVLTGKTEGTFYLAAYDKDSKELWKNEITDKMYDKDVETLVVLETDKDGNIYLFNGFYGTAVWKKNGEFQFKLRSDTIMQGLTRIGDKVYVYLREDNQAILREVDVKKQDWKETKYEPLPDTFSLNGKAIMEQAKDRLLVYTYEGLSSYDMKKGNSENLFDWTRYGLVPNEIYAGCVQGENIYFVAAVGSNVKLATFSPAAEGEVPAEKEVITINPEDTYGYMDEAIRRFNAQSDKYVVEYAEKMQGTGREQDAKRDIEIVAGKGTDIICLGSDVQKYYKYADLGILEDLYPYLDEDEETDREDYLPNVLEAFERDGKLCCMVPSFLIETLTIPTKYVGDKKSFTIEEFEELVANMPEGINFSTLCWDKSLIFHSFLRWTYPMYIDYTTYTCDFESEDFIEWLKFLNSIETEDEKAVLKKSQKDYLIAVNMKTWITDYQFDKFNFGEEDITYVGYPGNNGNGSFIDNTKLVGIWSESEHKEGAWEFIKFVMSEEMQETLEESELRQIPVRISTLEKECAEAMTPEYETDKNGNKVEKVKGYFPVFGGEPVPHYAATEKDVAKIRELIDSVNTSMVVDGKIEEIIMEEVAAFYEGDKTAEEVAGYIQNRVQTYLNEMKP